MYLSTDTAMQKNKCCVPGCMFAEQAQTLQWYWWLFFRISERGYVIALIQNLSPSANGRLTYPKYLIESKPQIVKSKNNVPCLEVMFFTCAFALISI